jgi:hypothetical protein
MGQNDGILSAREHEHRPFKLSRRFAQDEDGLGFQSLEVGQ